MAKTSEKSKADKPQKAKKTSKADVAEQADRSARADDDAPAVQATKQAKETPQGKFAQFIAAQKIDQRRILAVSHRLERLQPEDRAIKLNKRRAKKAGADGGDNVPKETRKPRTGRPLTARAIRAALRGSANELSGPTKTRLLRAVNHLLGLKKQEKVDLKALF
jgi:hypothetical protein